MSRLRSRLIKRTGHWLFAFALSVYASSAGGSLTTTDAVVAFDLTQSIVERGSVALSGNLLGMDAHVGADGRAYSPFGIAQSIYNVPFYLAGKVATTAVSTPIGKPDSLLKAAVALGQTVVVALLVWQIFMAALIVAPPRAALTAALTCAFAGLLWPYSSFGFNQPLAAVTLLAAVTAALRGVRGNDRRLLVWSGVWLGASLLTRHEMALAAIPIGIWILLERHRRWPDRWRSLAAFAPGLVAAAAIWMVYNAVRFHNPLDPGLLRDPVPGLGSPIVPGMVGLLFSPAASIFLYSPFAIFGVVGLVVLFRRDRSLAVLLGAICLGALLFYASLANWIGGRSYGSRYLFVILPLLGIGWAALLSHMQGRWRTALVVAVMTTGVIVQLPGVLVDYSKVSQAAAVRDGGPTTVERQWSWRAAPLVLNARALTTAVPENAGYLSGRRPLPEIVAAISNDDRSYSQQFAFSLDFWWPYLFYLGAVDHAVMPEILVVLSAMVVWCGLRLRRAAQALPAHEPPL